MHPRAAFRISLAAGLLVLAVTLLSATQEPLRPCGNLPQNYAPIIAFELARSNGDLQAIFGTQEPCRAKMIERMDAINLVDVLVFIPAYGVFMAFFFLGMRARHAMLGTLGSYVSLVTVLGDYAENACLMSLTPALDPSSAWFALLPWATAVKWLALGAAGAIAAVLYKSNIATVLSAASLFVAVSAILSPAQTGPILSLGVGLSWLLYLITAAAAAFRPAANAAELPRPG
jgi:hypothetical protein